MAKKNSRPNLAARKSASKKAEEQKLAARKAYWEANRKQILTIAGIALAIVLVLALAADYFIVPKNTVRSFMGNLIDAKENALIREMNGRYYEFGTVDTPAGYAVADYGIDMVSDPQETFFYYEAEEEGKAVQSAYTVGVKERSAEDMLSSVYTLFNYEMVGEIKKATIGGHEVHYFYSQSVENSEIPDVFLANITAYVDSVKNSCVLVSLASESGALETLPTEEAMLADAEGIFASFQINK